jgi:hypothetical protein
MSKLRFYFTLAAIALGVCSGLKAQDVEDGLSLGPSARPFTDAESGLIDTEFYEYDAQLWAPYERCTMDGCSERLCTGYYAELGFAYLAMSGPSPVPGADPRLFEDVSNWNWARDWELGYMSTKGSGWGVEWLDLEGTAYLRDSEFSGVGGGWEQPIALRSTFDNVGVVRQFRQQLSNGGVIEPYIGFRFISMIDQTNEDWNIADPIPSTAPTTQRRFSQKSRNSMAGGYVGTRYSRTYGRMTLGSNLGVGAAYNNQVYSATSITGNFVFPSVNADGEPAFTVTNRGNEMVPVMDLGLQLSYHLTRDITFRAGAKLHWAWEGVARADTRGLDTNPYSFFNGLGQAADPLTAPPTLDDVPDRIFSEDLFVGGLAFGIDWNR